MKRRFLLTALAALLISACAAKPAPVPAVEPLSVSPAMAPTPAAAASQEDLTVHPWKWIAFVNPVERFEVETPESYLLMFQPDGTVDIQADCNRARGSYTADGSRLSIIVGPMTLAQCPPGSRSDDFIRYLGGAAIYFFRDGNLFIDMMADGGTLQLAPLE